MRLARLGPPGHEVPVVLDGDEARDLRSLTADIDAAFLATGLDAVRAALDANELPILASHGVRVGAPIARPGAVVCVGMNYAAHAAESGSAPPTQPVIFLKHPNTVVGPNDDFPLAAHAHKMDWEVELAIVIGRTVWNLSSREEAMACVAGATIADDLSERTWQLEVSGGQWSKGKCAPHSTPLGPVLVTVDELDLGNLRLTSRVNGETRQDSSTADLIFDVATVVHDLSRYMRLDPGDLILTGTPEGVALSGRFPYLTDGDVVEIEIDGIGVQRHRVVAEASA
ncbi:2-keto-4-pentenoate hydratase/2-oxohepta-3-ene-1,7-dioic acid hydratase in catechol pathway [Microcella alkaliphila]|uniref:2-keto-4-pentenoate hydratase/2-oxohepta-3-ene-1,7-dioic acid hydratase in catechol pathway n=1 Tax=Microcella alkaliphila TaxID=279828 RepID=A0A4Q7THY1_9MICO|nr:fumarylacetoacetate hydrolase family protein [Microcella alkaliphila]RZT59527.1 2-keto-4-pentenoate hydratase/2-oxohepta-3-ene-1,7-dioic acid hydratase in catechol pathway [Microcella alkaliphila]